MDESCGECRTLWNQYRQATVEHVKTGRDHEATATRGDLNAFFECDGILRQAIKKKDAAFEAIMEHEMRCHGRQKDSISRMVYYRGDYEPSARKF